MCIYNDEGYMFFKTKYKTSICVSVCVALCCYTPEHKTSFLEQNM